MMKICFFATKKYANTKIRNSSLWFQCWLHHFDMLESTGPSEGPATWSQYQRSHLDLGFLSNSTNIHKYWGTAIWGPRNLVMEAKMLEKWLQGSQLLTLPTFYYAFIQTALYISGLWLTVSQISIKAFSCKTEPIQNSSVIKWLHWFHWRVHFVSYAHSAQHIWDELDK